MERPSDRTLRGGMNVKFQDVIFVCTPSLPHRQTHRHTTGLDVSAQKADLADPPLHLRPSVVQAPWTPGSLN